MRDGMFVFDTHNHTHPPVRTTWGVFGQTPDEVVARMDRNGVDMSMIMGIHQMTPDDQWQYTEYVVEGARRYPDRLIPIQYVTPMWGSRAVDEMKRGYDVGIKGIKLYAPGMGNFPIDSPLLDPIVEQCIEFGWVIVIHTDIDSKVCSPHLGLRLGRRHPEAKVQLSHFGLNSDVSPFMAEWCKDVPNVWLDTSASACNVYFVYKLPMESMPDRLLYGSDGPTLYDEIEFHKIAIAERDFGLTEDEKRKILGVNAAKLYGIDLDAWAARHQGASGSPGPVR